MLSSQGACVLGTIFNIQKFCLHDGDGIRTNVFLKGCPLRCIWCHNPEGLESTPSLSFSKARCTACGRCLPECPARTLKDGKLVIDRTLCTVCGKCVKACLNGACEVMGREATVDEVMKDVLKDKVFYDRSGGGITLSGGEPSYQEKCALDLLEKSKEAGIGIAVETCGAGPRSFYEKAADLGTTFLFDLKCMDSEKHKKLTGADNRHILETLEYLMKRKADVILRLPLIPGINDTEEDLDALASFLNKNEGRYRYAEIMPYHSLGVGKSEKLGKEPRHAADGASSEDKERWMIRFKNKGVSVRISE